MQRITTCPPFEDSQRITLILQEMNAEQRRQLVGYVRKRLEALDYCNAAFENTISDEKQELMDSVNAGKIEPNDPDLLGTLFKYNYLILPTFRNGMLVSACSLIEDVLLRIGTDSISDFKSHVQNLRRRGISTVRKYIQVIQDHLLIDFSEIDDSLKLIDDLIKVRNAIVHAWGKIEKSRSPNALRKIVARHNWLQESDDGYIIVEDETYADAITPFLSLIEHILDSLPQPDN